MFSQEVSYQCLLQWFGQLLIVSGYAGPLSWRLIFPSPLLPWPFCESVLALWLLLPHLRFQGLHRLQKPGVTKQGTHWYELPDLALHDPSKFIKSNEETNWGWNVALNYTSSDIDISGVHSLAAFLLDPYSYFGRVVNCSH